MRPEIRAFALLWALGALAAPSPGRGHTLSRSASHWRIEGAEVRVHAEVPVTEIARRRPNAYSLGAPALLRNPGLRAWLSAYLVEGLRPVGQDLRCRLTRPPLLLATAPRRIAADWSLRCSAPPAALRCDLFFDRAPSHLHFLRARTPEGRREAALTSGRRELSLRPPPGSPEPPAGAPGGGLLDFASVGLHHVAIGPDHVAFVVALMLLGGSLWAILKIATGFTLGHSITLTLAAMGELRPSEAAVEALVGLSVAYAALECFYAWSPPRGRRRVFGLNLLLHGALLATDRATGSAIPIPVLLGSLLLTTCHLGLHRRHGATPGLRTILAFSFGLVHGLAFAGAFREGLGGDAVLVPLLGFNLGVEAGQIAVIAGVLLLLAAVRRGLGARARALTAAALAAAVLALGTRWALTRAASGSWKARVEGRTHAPAYGRTTSRSPLPRPKVSGWYISSALGGGAT